MTSIPIANSMVAGNLVAWLALPPRSQLLVRYFSFSNVLLHLQKSSQCRPFRPYLTLKAPDNDTELVRRHGLGYFFWIVSMQIGHVHMYSAAQPADLLYFVITSRKLFDHRHAFDASLGQSLKIGFKSERIRRSPANWLYNGPNWLRKNVLCIFKQAATLIRCTTMFPLRE